MMLLKPFLAIFGAAATAIAATCSGVSTVVVLSTTIVHVPATSFLTISSTVLTVTNTITITSATTSTRTSTSYTGAASTSYVFLPGSPPAKRDSNKAQARAACNADNCLRALRATRVLASAQAFCSSYTTQINNPVPFPTYVPSDCNASRVSSACSCLPTSCTTPTSVSIVTVSVTSAKTKTQTQLVTATTTTTVIVTTGVIVATTVTSHSAATTRTVYPCASPVNFQGPTYGDAAGTSNLGLSNSLYYLTTPQGESAQACCNTCFFGIENCVQAFWYSYEGCVVSQATDLSSGTGVGLSTTCPAGLFAGLTYGPDVAPAFRSTGNIAGPCGVLYTNF